MNTRHLVDHDLLPFLDAFGTVSVTDSNLHELRGAMMMPNAAEFSGSTMETRRIPGPEGAPDVGIVIYRPTEAVRPMGCVFHIHGGAYVLGSADMMGFKYQPIAGQLGCVVVSVDYRLAPETAFPGGIEDCYAALRWVFDASKDLGIDSTRIGVVGESAGGGYAAALSLLARDRLDFKLAFQQLISPMLDDRTGSAGRVNRYAGEFICTPETALFGWRSLLGKEAGNSGVSCYAAAARAEDLAGLPPAYLAVGALDLFVDETVDYAHRLIRAGVPTELHVYPGGFHGFEVADAPVARKAMADSIDALRRFL